MSINKDSQKAPNLRFKGFTDDWEQRKLGEILTERKLKKKISKETPLLAFAAGQGVIDRSERKTNNRDFLTKDASTKTYLVTKYDDIVYNPSNLKYGAIDRNKHGQGVISPIYVTFETKQVPSFVELIVKSDRFRESALQYEEGTVTKRQSVKPENLLSLNVFLATSRYEQEKIGTFFKVLDDTITLHQRKLDHLNQLKEALLQQMFPGKGETVPKLRFAGFEGDWEERKLSALFIKGGSGGTPKSTNKDFYEGNIPFLGISDITRSNGFINNTEKHISVDGLNNSAAWVVPRGSISLAMYASVGKVAVLNIDAATSQAFYNMVFDDNDLRDFVYQCLIKANVLSEWNKLISTGTQANLNADKVKNFMLYLPQNHAEIKLISAFLKQFDATIAIQQRTLDQIKNMKQVLLQNMFI
ncbi:restriction endonuclease subunit S [Aerococcus urinaeequi]|uniref:restriction endonuclease subunit S n=1 Tax=Aerococcus urinaeequi TaxID=51665 RepID=UPI003D6A22FE